MNTANGLVMSAEIADTCILKETKPDSITTDELPAQHQARVWGFLSHLPLHKPHHEYGDYSACRTGMRTVLSKLARIFTYCAP